MPGGGGGQAVDFLPIFLGQPRFELLGQGLGGQEHGQAVLVIGVIVEELAVGLERVFGLAQAGQLRGQFELQAEALLEGGLLSERPLPGEGGGGGLALRQVEIAQFFQQHAAVFGLRQLIQVV